MSVPFLKSSFAAGEISPSLFGHVDLARFSIGASTMRNAFVSYRGGAYSRAGTLFAGFSKQTGRGYPPRMIPFQFSINQGLALEFGNEYMRVLSGGQFVTDESLPITGATNANPVVISAAPTGGASATAVTTSVISSYAPGELITLTGGTFVSPAVLAVTNTFLKGLQVNSPGVSGYVPADTIHLTGGVQSSAAILTVATTQVVSATINAAGSGGINGTQTVTGTTGTGTKFQARVTVAGGIITAVLSISVGGSYTANPTTLTAEPVTGASLSGAKLAVLMGVYTFAISTPGLFTTNPVGGTFTQTSSSGSGTGATFNFALMAPSALTISNPGVYSSHPSNPVAQSSTTGSGLGAAYNVNWTAVPSFNNGDWVEISSVNGMTQLNGRTFIVQNVTSSGYTLTDIYGNNIDSTAYGAYISGGLASRIYTLVTPYAEQDLPYLKYTESADVMTLTCWNQITGTSYPPYDLARFADNNWTLTQTTFASLIAAPATCAAVANTTTGSSPTDYNYVVTAVDSYGNESVASPIGDAPNSVDIASTAGSINVSWSGVVGAQTYNIYKAPPAYNSTVPAGSLFGFVGSAYGNSFVDSNVQADLTQVPPTFQNPFAVSPIIGLNIIAGGSGFSQSTVGYTIATATGSGLVLLPIVQGGTIVGAVIQNGGENYASTDTISFTGGTGASATLILGAATGTFPSVANYYQQRRVYASSPNNPDTYWMSVPGAFTNMDSRVPSIASDSITGTPWAVQVNGIQFLIPMPGGLVALTGLSAWQLTGAGGSSLNPQPITPSTQQAQPQAYNGCSATVPPIKIDYEILYVQAKGSIYRDLSYNFFTNIYTGIDITQISSQLFTGFSILEHAWCEEPFKVLWAVRDDGVLLSLTFLKQQEVSGWARHDTNGLFKSVCSISEHVSLQPSTGSTFTDALYTAVQRFFPNGTAYTIERLDDRIWASVENCWCVDCALSTAGPAPNATLTASSATGLGSLTGVTNLVGGANYSSSTVANIVDDNGTGPGTGAAATVTVVGGVIIAVTVSPAGTKYTNPRIDFIDPAGTGSGASASLILNNAATFTASASVFSANSIGSVIRMGGGIATITAFTDSAHVTANITSPIVQTVPNSGGMVQPQVSGDWSLTVPVTTVSGLDYLAGMTVTGLYDGQVIPPTVVSAGGSITLPAPATSVIVGLGFQVQIQSVYLDAGSPTIQGQRKKVSEVTARVEASGAFKMGSNQPDGSTQSPMRNSMIWNGLDDAPTKAVPNYGSNVVPLWTGDIRIPVKGGFQKPGQVALQQDLPLPLQLLALIPEILPGDTPQTAASPREKGRQAS